METAFVIPEWIFWVLGVLGIIVILLLAYIGKSFCVEIMKWFK